MDDMFWWNLKGYLSVGVFYACIGIILAVVLYQILIRLTGSVGSIRKLWEPLEK